MIKFIKELEEQIKEIETKAINDTYNSIWNHINIVIHELERQIPSINRFIEIYSDEEETLKMKKNDLKEINERLANIVDWISLINDFSFFVKRNFWIWFLFLGVKLA